MSEKLAVE